MCLCMPGVRRPPRDCRVARGTFKRAQIYSVNLLAPSQLPLQALELLNLDLEGPGRALPDPRMFPNLRIVGLGVFAWDPAWLGRLGQLPRLERLELHCAAAAGGGQPAQAYVAPALPTLIFLHFHIDVDDPSLPAAGLSIDLAALTSLLELELWTNARVELLTAPNGAAGSPAGPLHRLRRLQLCNARCAGVDFAALPALATLHIATVQELPCADTIAGATSLRYLSQGRDLRISTI